MQRSPSGGARSVLFAPGNHPRKVEKVFGAGADLVVLDLEDAVPPAEKTAARVAVIEALGRPRPCRGFVRINGYGSAFWEADLEAAVRPGVDGIVLPKAESAAQLRELDARIASLERSAGLEPGALELMPIVESARGVVQAGEIAAAVPRVRRLAFGGADYTFDLDLQWSVEEHELAYARAALAHASRVADIEPPIDTVVVEVRDPERFRRSARNGRAMGFQGKLCIHPDQVPLCHEVFTPSAEEIARARAVIRAFEEAEARGSASIEVAGGFVDYPVVNRARRIVALAERGGGGSRL